MTSFESLEMRLEQDYDAFHLSRNPVSRSLEGLDAGEAVAQYALFPCKIVELLGAMAFRLRAWKGVHEELLDNIAQECGSLTHGRAHFSILRAGLQRDLGIDGAPTACPETSRFFDETLLAIRAESPDFVAGMAFALEASAVPELLIVAELFNAVARISGRTLITRHKTASREYAENILSSKQPGDYTLEDFLVVHLLAIEVEHRDGLKSSLRDVNALDMSAVARGFEHLLNLMDQWWRGLAEHARSKAVEA